MKLKSVLVIVALITVLCAVIFTRTFLSRTGVEAPSVSKSDLEILGSEKASFSDEHQKTAVTNSWTEANESSLLNEPYAPPPNKIFNQTEARLRNDPEKWFEEANVLATPDLPEAIYVDSLHQLLDQYVVIVKDGGYPTGFNYEVTNALLGKNSKKIALLSQSHPRINDEGELVDQWGTPYFFHFESLSDVSIQSAGPDLEMHTEDDVSSSNTDKS